MRPWVRSNRSPALRVVRVYLMGIGYRQMQTGENMTDHVAETATVESAVDTGQITLIGVAIAFTDRRALVRFPSGYVRTLRIGDSLDGGRVVAIGESELRYHKASRIQVLTLPD